MNAAMSKSLVQVALRTARFGKERAVRDDGIGTDLPLSLLLLRDGRPLGWGFPYGTMEEVGRIIVGLIGFTDTDEVLMVVEAFSYLFDEKPVEPLNFGDLAQRFADGDPRACECLQIIKVTRTGKAEGVMAPYRYEGRRVVWDEIAECGAELHGGTIEMVRSGFVLQGTRPMPAMSLDTIAKVFGCDVIETLRPRRRGPCPCGSGRKAKACCFK